MKRSRVKVSIGHTLRDRPCVREWCKSLEDICRETETGREREKEKEWDGWSESGDSMRPFIFMRDDRPCAPSLLACTPWG